MNPYSARLRERLAQFYMRQGRTDDALDYQRKAIALHPLDVGHHLGLAEMLWTVGEKEEAKTELLKTLDMKPNALEKEKRRSLAATFGIDLED